MTTTTPLTILQSITNKLRFKTFKTKCKFYNTTICDHQSNNSATCTETGGEYYGPGRHCGQYRHLSS